MNASSNHPTYAPRLASAQLAAAIGIIISQALTMQRSLKSPGISDYVGIGVCWVLLPILVTLAWFKWRDSRFTSSGDAWCLSIGALLQSTMLVAWPATIMPSTLFFWMGDTLVTLTGGWIQSAIIGVALCLGIHAVAFSASGRIGGTSSTAASFALAIGAGTGLGGFGLLLATYFGWTMYLFSSIIVWLTVGIYRFYKLISTPPSKTSGTELENARGETSTPKVVDIAARLSGWAGAILGIFPLLLLSMNFQRHRYAAGYWFPLLLVGIVSSGCVFVYHGLSRISDRKYKSKSSTSAASILARYAGLVAALCIDAALTVQLVLAPPVEAAAFFKSWMYLWLTCASVVACLPALGGSLSRLSVQKDYDRSPGRAFGRIFYSGTLLAIIIVVFLLEGTSMIYSWEFGDEETWIVAAIAVGLGVIFFCFAIVLDIVHAVETNKEARGKRSVLEEK